MRALKIPRTSQVTGERCNEEVDFGFRVFWLLERQRLASAGLRRRASISNDHERVKYEG